MAKNAIEAVKSPIGELEWVIIDGEGKEDLQGNMKYQVNVVPDNEAAEKFIEKLTAFWEANKPKGIKEPKSLGFYAHKIPTGEKDEDGAMIYEETGKTTFTFKTGTTYKDDKPKIIKVFNAKGDEVNLGSKKIGNGSRGRADGAMAIYTVENKGKVMQAGVTLYLNGVQLAKFVEYAGGPNFDEIPEEEGDFEGFGEVGAISDSEPEKSTSSDKPKL